MKCSPNFGHAAGEGRRCAFRLLALCRFCTFARHRYDFRCASAWQNSVEIVERTREMAILPFLVPIGANSVLFQFSFLFFLSNFIECNSKRHLETRSCAQAKANVREIWREIANWEETNWCITVDNKARSRRKWSRFAMHVAESFDSALPANGSYSVSEINFRDRISPIWIRNVVVSPRPAPCQWSMHSPNSISHGIIISKPLVHWHREFVISIHFFVFVCWTRRRTLSPANYEHAKAKTHSALQLYTLHNWLLCEFWWFVLLNYRRQCVDDEISERMMLTLKIWTSKSWLSPNTINTILTLLYESVASFVKVPICSDLNVYGSFSLCASEVCFPTEIYFIFYFCNFNWITCGHRRMLICAKQLKWSEENGDDKASMSFVIVIANETDCWHRRKLRRMWRGTKSDSHANAIWIDDQWSIPIRC